MTGAPTTRRTLDGAVKTRLTVAQGTSSLDLRILFSLEAFDSSGPGIRRNLRSTYQ